MLSLKILQPVLYLFTGMVLIAIYIRYIEKRTIFYPAKEIELLPKEAGLDFEDIFFKTQDNLELNGWFLAHKDATQTILFCHGNAGNISHRLEKLKFFHGLRLNIFIFDYRGYGRSKGIPSERGLYLDVEAAYNYLLSRKVSSEQIIGFGESLGGAAAIDLVYKHKIKGLIVEGAVSCAKDMAKFIYPFLPPWIIFSRFDSVNKIKSIDTPKLIIHSINDEIVPYRLGRKLYDSASLPKEFLEVYGGHNSAFFESEAILKEKIADFLKRL